LWKLGGDKQQQPKKKTPPSDESKRGMLRRYKGKGKGEEKWIRKSNKGANLNKVHYMRVSECHDKAHYNVPFNICQ
jgi:hypothetical protein